MPFINPAALLLAVASSVVCTATAAASRPGPPVLASNPFSLADGEAPLAPFLSADLDVQLIGDPAVQMDASLTFTYASPEQVLLENLNADAGPIESAEALGFTDWPGSYEPMLAAYFAQHPEVDFAVAWWTAPPGGNLLTSAVTSEKKTVGPADVCGVAAAIAALQSIGGNPIIGAGVAGIALKAVKTKNAVDLYVEKGGAAVLEVGHTFVKLTPDGGAGTYHGFYPKMLTLDNLHKEIDAALSDDKDHDWTYKVSWLVTTDNYNKAAKFVKDELADRAGGTLRKYFLLDLALGGAENCTSWAVSVVGKTGTTTPNAKTGLFGAGVYDPKALNKSLTTVGDGNLFNGCGTVMKKPAGPAPEGDVEVPLDFSPEDFLLQAIEDPASIAAHFGAASSDELAEPLVVAPGGTVQVNLSGAAVGEFTTVIEWGDGEYSLFSDMLEATHPAPLVDGQIRVVVFEGGSVQRTVIPVHVQPDGDDVASLLVLVDDFPYVEVSNGPFVAVDPVILDLSSCLTDCNADGIADCKQVDARTGGDCDGNGQLDSCDIAEGTLADVNQDGIPDSCQCIADLNGDAVVDGADLGMLLAEWMTPAPSPADLNGDGMVDSNDLGILLGAWGPC